MNYSHLTKKQTPPRLGLIFKTALVVVALIALSVISKAETVSELNMMLDVEAEITTCEESGGVYDYDVYECVLKFR